MNVNLGRMVSDGSNLVIHPCQGIGEIDACVDIQGQVWGYDERDIIPRRLFIVAQRIGGQVFGAFSTETSSRASTLDPMVGFAMALPAYRHKQLYLHSHMLAVKAEWRNAGIGRSLKLAQREEALGRGIGKMEWTFDPLEIKNAYLNIHRLGCIVRSYSPDFYGPSTSALQAGLQTDRLHAEWLLDSERVAKAIDGKESATPQIVRMITVPALVSEWKATPGELHKAVEVQKANRELFLGAFKNGLAVVGFTRDVHGNGHYHLAEPLTA